MIDEKEKGDRGVVPFSEIQQAPDIGKYRAIFEEANWRFVRMSICNLSRYEDGLQGIEYLLKLTDAFRKQLSEKEITENKHKLWSFHLDILDALNLWEEYIEVYKKNKQEPEGKSFQPTHWIRLTLKGQKALNAAPSRYAWWRMLDALWEGADPRAEAFVVTRQQVIQRKLDRLKAGKSVSHLKRRTDKNLTEKQFSYEVNLIKSRYHDAQEQAKEWAQWREKWTATYGKPPGRGRKK